MCFSLKLQCLVVGDDLVTLSSKALYLGLDEALEVRIIWIERQTEFGAPKVLSSRIEVQADVRYHGMDIAPVALHWIAVVVGTAATGVEEAAPCTTWPQN